MKKILFIIIATLAIVGCSKDEEEEIISIGEEEEIPHKVVDEDFETGSYEKEDEKKESEQNYVSVNESIEMEVETQGIPMEQLLAKGKSMFSHVNFNK